MRGEVCIRSKVDEPAGSGSTDPSDAGRRRLAVISPMRVIGTPRPGARPWRAGRAQRRGTANSSS
jgi:hypothetical protein